MRRIPDWPKLAALVGALVVLMACGAGAAAPRATAPPQAQHPYAPLAALQAEPAAALRPPDTTRLGGGGREPSRTLNGPQPAVVTVAYGTQEATEAVFAWYERELRALGYTPADGGFTPATTEHAVRGWCKPGTATLRVGIQNQAKAFDPSYLQGNTYTTVFNARLAGLLPTEGCPKS